MTLDEFFAGRDDARLLFEAVRDGIATLGPVDLRVTKSQISFRRRIAFAWVWTPDRYLGGETAPLVVSLALRRRDASPRWKQVVALRPWRFMHHLELYSPAEIDGEVMAWLREAWSEAS